MILKISLLSSVLLSAIFFVGLTSCQPTYDPLLDVTGDGYGGIDDIVAVAEHFGASGTPINWTQVLENITALEQRVTDLEGQSDPPIPKVCAGIDNPTVDSSSQITITFSGVTFTNPAKIKFSASVIVMSGAEGVGSPARVTGVDITTANVVLTLQCWNGVSWVAMVQDDVVQVSWTALEQP